MTTPMITEHPRHGPHHIFEPNTVAERRMRQAYHAGSALQAEGLLTELARELGKTHPGAAASLREGMAETLTIVRLGVPPTLARTLRSTNPVESMIEICREHSKNVKRSISDSPPVPRVMTCRRPAG